MSSRKRLVLVLAAVVVVVGLSLFLRPRATDDLSAAPADAEQSAEPARGAALSAPVASGAAGGGAQPSQEPEPVAEVSTVSAECQACREQECTNYLQSGVDLLKGCFKEVDPAQGADTFDATFLNDCAAVVRCAARTHCGDGTTGAAGCYCGSRSLDDCVNNGPGRDAPCLDEWRRAARSSKHDEIAERFSDFKYPSGWASAMVDCEHTKCKSKCSG